MQPKKNEKVDLSKNSSLYFVIGLSLILLISWQAIEWKTYDKSLYGYEALNVEDDDDEEIPITEQIKTPPPPPPPPPPEIIEIVEDEVEIEKELEIEETETDEDEIIEIEEDDEEFFMVVENMPEFPGGDLGLMKFIQKNVRYPAIAKEYNITGKVYVSFIVDKQGNVTNVKIVRGVDKNLDAEAKRVVSSLPKYKPGKQRGKPVRVMFTIPINFTLN